MRLELSYESLVDTALNSTTDIKLKKTMETIQNYQRLNMPTGLIEKARAGAVSIILKQHGLRMLISKRIINSNTSSLWEVEESGDDRSRRVVWNKNHMSGGVWQLTKLKNFPHPVPLEILEKLPDSASTDAMVFYPIPQVVKSPDPILAYPLMFNRKRRRKTMRFKPTWYGGKYIKEVIIKNMAGPYFAAIYRWE